MIKLLSGLAPELFMLALGGAFAWVYTLYLTVLSEPRSKDFADLRRNLERGDGIETAYTRTLRRVLMWADRFFEGKPYKYEPPAGKWQARAMRLGLRLFGRPTDYRRPDEVRLPGWRPNAWSARTYDRCLLLAIVYPVLAGIVAWAAFGDGGVLTAGIGVAPEPDLSARVLTVALFCAAAVAGFLFDIYDDDLLLALFLFLLFMIFWFFWFDSFAVLIFFVFARSINQLNSIFSIFMISSIYLIFYCISGAFVPIISILWLISYLFYDIIATLISNSIRFFFVLIFLIIIILCEFSVFAYFNLNSQISTVRFTLLLAIGLLPLINAPFDWASIGLTRTLLYRNLDTPSARMRFVWSALDLVGALALLVLLALTSVLAMEMFNAAAFAGGAATPPVDVAGMLADIGAEPYAARHFWLYFALFSTLLPTLIHCLVWVVSTATVRIGPLQRWLVDGLDNRLGHGTATRHKIAAVLTLRWLIPIPLVLGASIWLLALAGQAPWLGGAFLTLLQNEQMFVSTVLR